jgi:hypothetical protein
MDKHWQKKKKKKKTKPKKRTYTKNPILDLNLEFLDFNLIEQINQSLISFLLTPPNVEESQITK